MKKNVLIFFYYIMGKIDDYENVFKLFSLAALGFPIKEKI